MMTHHILTIASLERRRWWRRRFLQLQLSFPLALVCMILWYLSTLGEPQTSGTRPITEADLARFHLAMTAFPIGVTIMALAMLLTVTGMILLTESMPQDHQLRVNPLLESLPLAPGAYVLGKLLGALAAQIQLYGIGVAILLGLTRIIIGPLMLKELLLLAALCSVPMLVVTALSILLSTMMKTRRQTLGIVGIVALLMIAQGRLEVLYPNSIAAGLTLLPSSAWLNQLVLAPSQRLRSAQELDWGYVLNWSTLTLGMSLQLLILGLLALAMIGWRRRAH